MFLSGCLITVLLYTLCMSTKKASFIVLDGGEGAGKSTQIQEIKKHFGDRIVITREPGGSLYAEEIRGLILGSEHAGQANAKTHFALFWAARADHLKNTIIPALESGKHVVCDRFDSSTFAYQIFGQEAHELKDFFFSMRDFYLGDYKPDLYVLLDVDPETGLGRKQNQTGEVLNHFDERQISFHTRMREGLIEFFEHVPHKIVDARPEFDVVTKDLISVLEAELN